MFDAIFTVAVYAAIAMGLLWAVLMIGAVVLAVVDHVRDEVGYDEVKARSPLDWQHPVDESPLGGLGLPRPRGQRLMELPGKEGVMSEVIQHIGPYKAERPEGYGEEEGFQIRTNEQIIKLAISNDQSCCEDWGYFLTEDDTARFVGADLQGVRITDTNRSSRQFSKSWEPWDADNAIHVDEGDVMFVDIETSEGPLQFVAYNAHNGYYGHAARVESRQVTEEKYL